MQQAIGAGARFITTTHVDPEIIKSCREKKVCVIVSALTPTEISLANRFGADLVRLFPVDSMGGASYLEAIKESNPSLRLMVAGINIAKDRVLSYFQSGAVAVEVPHVALGTGSLKKGEWPKIAAAAQKISP